jgi:5-methylcytosine-specific restriction endonuclease McrA
MKDKTRASNTMTESQFISFVKGHLRRASRWWKPISDTIKAARVRKGVYLCNGCKEEVTTTIVVDGKRMKNIFCDHVAPVVDPTTGFSGWDEFVNRLFCEKENLQVLCKVCHDKKSKEEREHRSNKKDNDND